MRHRILPVLMLLSLVLALPGRADGPPSGGGGTSVGSVVTTGPAGVYQLTVTAPGGVKIYQTPTSVTYDWSGYTPVPPTPEPDPIPPNPSEWGPISRVLILYETSTLTGREAICSQDIRTALDALPKDSKGLPQWRIWDRDLTTTLPDWIKPLEAARADYGSKSEPVLYAVDTVGRLKSIPIPAATTPAQLVEIIKGVAK
jgi:hypothetical protein